MDNVLPCNVEDRLQELLLDDEETNIGNDELPVTFKDVQPGGKYVQKCCAFAQKVAIIIPYGDRKEQLDTVVRHLHRLLQSQHLCYGIYVSELAYPTVFNKGLLMNVAYLTARDEGHYDCYIFHDVDLISQKERHLYICGEKPNHMSSFNTKFGGLPYIKYIGGVLALNDTHVRVVNGFSNLLFGWGGEDDVMEMRIADKHLGLTRVSADIGRYKALPHDRDKGNPVNNDRYKMYRTLRKHTDQDGLTSLAGLYELLKVERRPLYTWIYIKCNKTEVLQKNKNIVFG
ncbi:beta-1,4-galactosyltransferase 4-like [Mya arenaria]|uniref:beta-1,4-galactosyltransferase 4-like n=1 Tax=Mya arenaria TaxID=6604 RepID=UPI0022E5A9A7|nr:beta-1,4-galactosyltransferase 4-like [Mya arenaria]